MRVALSVKNFSGYNGSARIIGELSKRFARNDDSVNIIGNTINTAAVRAYDAEPVEIGKFIIRRKLSRDAYMEKHKKYMQQAFYDLRVGNGDEAIQDILVMHNCVNLMHEQVNNIPSVGDACIRNVSKIHGQILKNRWFKKLVANSKLMRDDFVQRYGVPEEMARVIYPAHDHALFNATGKQEAKERFRAAHGIRAEKNFILGQVASGDFAKRGVKNFFNIYHRLPEAAAAKVQLVIVGKGKLEEFIEVPPANLTFIKHTDDPAMVMKSLDAMLYPALLEEFGLVITEALACGTPVITSRMVGASELFTGLHAESLCDKPDEQHMATVLEKIITDDSYRATLSEEAVDIVKKRTWDDYFNEFSRVVSEVMAGKSYSWQS